MAYMHIVELAFGNSMDPQIGSTHVPILSDFLVHVSADCVGSYLGIQNSGMYSNFHLNFENRMSYRDNERVKEKE